MNQEKVCYMCGRAQELEYNEWIEEWECLDCHLRWKSER